MEQVKIDYRTTEVSLYEEHLSLHIEVNHDLTPIEDYDKVDVYLEYGANQQISDSDIWIKVVGKWGLKEAFRECNIPWKKGMYKELKSLRERAKKLGYL